MNKIRAAKAALPPPEHEDESAGEAPLSARAMRRPGHYLDALNPEQREAVETLVYGD